MAINYRVGKMNLNRFFNYTGNLGKSFEYAVLEYSFSFWQWGRSCDSIPTSQSLDSYLDELLKTSNISFFSDTDIKQYEPHYYQALQTGYYSYNIEPFKKYIKHFTSNPSAIFPPKSARTNPSTKTPNEKLQEWLSKKGNNILYIYGGIDTWSAARIMVSDRVNSQSFLIPGAHHGSARIKNMPKEMQEEFAQKMKDWTDLKVSIDILR